MARESPPLKPSRKDAVLKSVMDMPNWKISGMSVRTIKAIKPGISQGKARRFSLVLYIGLDLGVCHQATISCQAPNTPSAAAIESGTVKMTIYCGHLVGQSSKNPIAIPSHKI